MSIMKKMQRMKENMEKHGDEYLGQEDDVLSSGGERFQIPTGVYDFEITKMYAAEAQSGSVSIVLEANTIDNMYTLRDRFLVLTADEKSTFVRDGKEVLFSSYVTVDTLCRLVMLDGEGVVDCEQDSKLVEGSVWNPEKRKFEDGMQNVLVDMIGGKFVGLVVQQDEWKREKNADGDYVDGTEVRRVSKLYKACDERGHTLSELKAQEEPTFKDTWLANNEGRITHRKHKLTNEPADYDAYLAKQKTGSEHSAVANQFKTNKVREWAKKDDNADDDSTPNTGASAFTARSTPKTQWRVAGK